MSFKLTNIHFQGIFTAYESTMARLADLLRRQQYTLVTGVVIISSFYNHVLKLLFIFVKQFIIELKHTIVKL